MATKKIQILGTDLLSHLGAIETGKIIPITLSASAWEGYGDGGLYKQKVNLDNIASNCKIDISFDLDKFDRESALSGCTFCVKNNNGDLWVYCNVDHIDEEEENISDINAQLYITTVTTTTPDPIWGSTCILI